MGKLHRVSDQTLSDKYLLKSLKERTFTHALQFDVGFGLMENGSLCEASVLGKISIKFKCSGLSLIIVTRGTLFQISKGFLNHCHIIKPV